MLKGEIEKLGVDLIAHLDNYSLILPSLYFLGFCCCFCYPRAFCWMMIHCISLSVNVQTHRDTQTDTTLTTQTGRKARQQYQINTDRLGEEEGPQERTDRGLEWHVIIDRRSERQKDRKRTWPSDTERVPLNPNSSSSCPGMTAGNRHLQFLSLL